MRKVNLNEAKSKLSELVRLALQEEDVAIGHNSEPIVRLVPVQSASGLRPVGLHRPPSSDVTDAHSCRSSYGP